MSRRLITFMMPIFWIASAAASAENDSRDILAAVAEHAVTVEQFERRWHAQPRLSSSRSTLADAESQLQEMVEDELLYAAAIDDGYHQSPEILAAIRRLIIDQYRQDTLMPALSAIKVGDEEVDAYYQRHSSSFSQPAARKGAIIRLSVPTTASPKTRQQQRARAEQARGEAEGLPADAQAFGAVAVKYSDHQPTRYRGGEIGWLENDGAKKDRLVNDRDDWPQAVVSSLFALEKPAVLSPVIETPGGFYLIKLIEDRPARMRPLEELKPRVVFELQQEKRGLVRKDFFAGLASRIPVETFPHRLETLVDGLGQENKRPARNPG